MNVVHWFWCVKFLSIKYLWNFDLFLYSQVENQWNDYFSIFSFALENNLFVSAKAVKFYKNIVDFKAEYLKVRSYNKIWWYVLTEYVLFQERYSSGQCWHIHLLLSYYWQYFVNFMFSWLFDVLLKCLLSRQCWPHH